jgi:hypothetical protein
MNYFGASKKRRLSASERDGGVDRVSLERRWCRMNNPLLETLASLRIQFEKI